VSMKRTAAMAAATVVILVLPGLDQARGAVTQNSIGLLRLNGDFGAVSHPSRYQFVILDPWEHAYIPQLKAENPGIKVLMYKNVTACKYPTGQDSMGNRFYSVGVGCQQADEEHPAWYLRDTAGKKIEFCYYPDNWFMDVGSASYQDAWLANVLADLQNHGWDGVMMDDTLHSPSNQVCDQTVAKYPTAAQFSHATRSFLSRVGPGLTSAGFLALPNIGGGPVYPATFADWTQFSSGAVREHWVKDADGFKGDGDWKLLMDIMDAVERPGKYFIPITYSPPSNVRAMRYARASFLLGWDGYKLGGSTSALIYHAGTGVDPWSEEWVGDVGSPLGDRYKDGAAWRRDFTEGTVVVNPSTSSEATVDLGGTYTMPTGTEVSSVSLQPTSGLMLSSTGDPEPGDPDDDEGSCTIVGTPANEELTGTPGDDVICAGGGNDTVQAGDGDDFIYGTDGNDVLRGGPGNDVLFGGPGDDAAFGDDGDDQLDGSVGLDSLSGGAGNDTVTGGTGSNRMLGSGGVDLLVGSTGRDLLNGGAGRDRLVGGPGANRLAGQGGPDVLVGGVARDLISGGTGRDSVQGRDGGDRLLVRDGIRDVGHGGSGRDACHVDRGDNLRSCG
jgi:hypothetical protein